MYNFLFSYFNVILIDFDWCDVAENGKDLLGPKIMLFKNSWLIGGVLWRFFKKQYFSICDILVLWQTISSKLWRESKNQIGRYFCNMELLVN